MGIEKVNSVSQKIITHIEALEKAMNYCAYQERCYKEVEDKLLEWKLNEDERDYVILKLIEGNYLNEERFARSFVSGKFRIKQWGRNKIKQKLKEKKISENCIKKGLEEIDEEEYLDVLSVLAEKKYATVKGRNEYEKKQKTAAWLYGRGYEYSLIWTVLGNFAS